MQAATQQRKRLAHGADDRRGQKLGQIAGNDARLIARLDRAQLNACAPREQIADGLAGGFAASAAENERAALDFALGMSVVALGYLLYEQVEQLRGSLLPVGVATLAGCVTGVLSVVYIARALGADRTILNSIAPKSVTVPIAVAISEPLGGVVSVTSVVVFLVGIFGSIVGPRLLRRCGIRNPLARGLALGSAAHGIGTARAIELGAVEGALSGLAMALMGIVTALLVPLFEKFCY